MLHPKEWLDFLITYVIVRHIIVGFIASAIMKYLIKTERHMAIWLHYEKQALGFGHHPKSVLDCGEGKCAVF